MPVTYIGNPPRSAARSPAGRQRAIPAPPPGRGCVTSCWMAGEAGAARQLAGLLRGGGRDRVAQRVARLVAETCAGMEPAEASRLCSALRDSVLELSEKETLTASEARTLCREIDAAEAATLEMLSTPHRALDALERALADNSA